MAIKNAFVHNMQTVDKFEGPFDKVEDRQLVKAPVPVDTFEKQGIANSIEQEYRKFLNKVKG